MPNIGPMELLLLGVLAVVIFGPAKLPEIARSIGRATREFKDSVTGTGIQEAIDGVGDVRSAVKPSNLAKAAMPASVKEMAADVTEMKDTLTDPLGQKKEKDEAEAGAAADGEESAADVSDPMPAARKLPDSVPAPAAPAPAAPETPAAPPA
jgi:sec-independent protein translocase protein TatA